MLRSIDWMHLNATLIESGVLKLEDIMKLRKTNGATEPLRMTSEVKRAISLKKRCYKLMKDENMGEASKRSYHSLKGVSKIHTLVRSSSQAASATDASHSKSSIKEMVASLSVSSLLQKTRKYFSMLYKIKHFYFLQQIKCIWPHTLFPQKIFDIKLNV